MLLPALLTLLASLAPTSASDGQDRRCVRVELVLATHLKATVMLCPEFILPFTTGAETGWFA